MPVNLVALEKLFKRENIEGDLRSYILGEEVETENFVADDAWKLFEEGRDAFNKDKYKGETVDLEGALDEKYISTMKPITNLVASVTGKDKAEIAKLSPSKQVDLIIKAKDAQIGDAADNKYKELLEKHNELATKFDGVSVKLQAEIDSKAEAIEAVKTSYAQKEEVAKVRKLKKKLLGDKDKIEFDKGVDFYLDNGILANWEVEFGFEAYQKEGPNGVPILGIRGRNGEDSVMSIDGNRHYKDAMEAYKDIAKAKNSLKQSNSNPDAIADPLKGIIKTGSGKIVKSKRDFLTNAMAEG